MKGRKYIKVVVTFDVYTKLCIEADKQGLTISALVRSQLENTKQVIQVEVALARIEAKLQPSKASRLELEPLLVESLLLIRELVADKNPQVLPRVASRLNTQYPQRREV